MAWAMRVDAGSCRHSKAEELGIPGRPGGAEPAGDSYGTVWPSTRMNGSCAHPESWAARVDASATTKNSTVATASSAEAMTSSARAATTPTPTTVTSGGALDGGCGVASVCSIPARFQAAWKHHAGQIEPEDSRIPAHSQPSTAAAPTVASNSQVDPSWRRWPAPNARLLVAAARYTPRLVAPQAAVRWSPYH